jgi:hypothetical protein
MLSVYLEVLPIPVGEILGLGLALNFCALQMILLLDVSLGGV